MKKSITTGILFLTTFFVSAQCFEKVFAGHQHFIAISEDGTLWAWGINNEGQLGDGSTSQKHTPLQISSETEWAHISPGGTHNVAVKSDGTLWAWGSNNYGKLGNGTPSGRVLYPMQIGTDTDWKEASAGDHGSVAVKTDGTLYTWGINLYGYLGNDMAVSYQNLTPTQVGAETDWKSVSGRARHIIALKNDGTLWAWGYNAYGQLGNGTSGSGTNVFTPMQIGNSTNWRWIETGNDLSYAMRENNSFWIWGKNSALGVNQAQPLQVGTHTDWKSVSVASHWTSYNDGAVLFVKQNGTLWAWGGDYNEVLGNGHQGGSYQSPTQIGTETDWESVAITYYQSNAIKSNGTFWAWGATQLVGNGTGNVPSPMQYACTSLFIEDMEITTNKLIIYPNPTNSIVNFSLPISGKIINISGKEILQLHKSTSVDISFLSKGVYFVMTTDGAGGKIIIN